MKWPASMLPFRKRRLAPLPSPELTRVSVEPPQFELAPEGRAVDGFGVPPHIGK